MLQHESSQSFSTSTCLFVNRPHQNHNEENALNSQQCLAHGIKCVPFNATQGTLAQMTCYTSGRGIVLGLILAGRLWVWIERFLNYNYPLLTVSSLFIHYSIFAVRKHSSFALAFHRKQSWALRVCLGYRWCLQHQWVSYLWKVMKRWKTKWKCPSPCLGIIILSAA